MKVIMTKEEMLQELEYCHYLNDKLRNESKQQLFSFRFCLILCLLFMGACIFAGIKFWNEYPKLAGTFFALVTGTLVLLGISIFKIISCKISIKKCAEMDIELEEKENKILNASNSTKPNIVA